MRNLLFAAICGLFLLQNASCQKGGQGVKTEFGNTFINHTNGSGPKIQGGEMATVNMYIWAGDSLISSTVRDQGGSQDVLVSPKKDITKNLLAYNEALLMMANGDSATIIQPMDSTLSKNVNGRFGLNAKELRFEIKVLAVLDSNGVKAKVEKTEARMQKLQARMEELRKSAEQTKQRLPEVKALVEKELASYNAGSLGDRLKKTNSGLEYIVFAEGEGEQFAKGEFALTHYYGCLKSDATMFDNSFGRGEPAPFNVGQLIPGFNEGMMKLRPGGKALLFIPAKLGYGARGQGQIPPNSDLVFYIELE